MPACEPFNTECLQRSIVWSPWKYEMGIKSSQCFCVQPYGAPKGHFSGRTNNNVNAFAFPPKEIASNSVSSQKNCYQLFSSSRANATFLNIWEMTQKRWHFFFHLFFFTVSL